MRTFLAALILFIMFASIIAVFSGVGARMVGVLAKMKGGSGAADVARSWNSIAAKLIALLSIALAFVILLAIPRTIREKRYE